MNLVGKQARYGLGAGCQRGPHPADWPRVTEAWGSLGHALALRGASGEPAGRRLSQLVFDLGEVVEAAKLYEQARGSAVVVVVMVVVVVVVVGVMLVE